jgi:hypothetical protein
MVMTLVKSPQTIIYAYRIWKKNLAGTSQNPLDQRVQMLKFWVKRLSPWCTLTSWRVSWSWRPLAWHCWCGTAHLTPKSNFNCEIHKQSGSSKKIHSSSGRSWWMGLLTAVPICENWKLKELIYCSLINRSHNGTGEKIWADTIRPTAKLKV